MQTNQKRIEMHPFEIAVPNLEGDAVAERVTVRVPVEWDEAIGEWLLTPEAHEIIDGTKARLMGLLSPAEIRSLRERSPLTQAEMSELLQTGAKSYTRWENGRGRPSRVINLLLRAVEDDVIPVEYLRALRNGADLRGRLRAAAAGWSRALLRSAAPPPTASAWNWPAKPVGPAVGMREMVPRGMAPAHACRGGGAAWEGAAEFTFTDVV